MKKNDNNISRVLSMIQGGILLVDDNPRRPIRTKSEEMLPECPPLRRISFTSRPPPSASTKLRRRLSAETWMKRRTWWGIEADNDKTLKKSSSFDDATDYLQVTSISHMLGVVSTVSPVSPQPKGDDVVDISPRKPCRRLSTDVTTVTTTSPVQKLSADITNNNTATSPVLNRKASNPAEFSPPRFPLRRCSVAA